MSRPIPFKAPAAPHAEPLWRRAQFEAGRRDMTLDAYVEEAVHDHLARKSARSERDAARDNRNELVHERNLLLALLTKTKRCKGSHIAPSKTTTSKLDTWRWVVCLHMSGRRETWKISDEQRRHVFAHLKDAPDDWVPHPHADKLLHLEQLVDELLTTAE